MQDSGGKIRRKRQLGKLRRRWEDNIKMGLREMGCRVLTGFIWFRMEANGGHFEHYNEPSCSTKREFPE
jgi:hypothetical protein